MVIKITGGGGTFEVLAIKDLRGQIPGAASSGGTSGGRGATNLNELTDVTLVSPILDNILQFDGAGQWLNVVNPAGLLTGDNLWTGFQDYTEQTIPSDPAASDMRFYVKRIDGTNQGLFVKLEQAGIIQEIRVV